MRSATPLRSRIVVHSRNCEEPSGCAVSAGISALRSQYDQLHLHSTPTPEEATKAIPIVRNLACFYMQEGEHDQAAAWLDRGLKLCEALWFGEHLQLELHGLLGINALRRGEVENCLECVGPSSCIYPIDAAAAHRQQAGSREAVKQFTRYLRGAPGDLRIRWLLNIAYMTLGEYPDKVPRRVPDPARRLPLEAGRRPVR